MKKFDSAKYIKKFQIPIILFSILAGCIGFYILNQLQSYSASAIIHYANDEASTGIAPDGSEIDITEIYSSKVITEVLNRMSLLNDNYSVDELRSRISVSPIREEEAENPEAVQTVEGEDNPEEFPVDYEVTFTAIKKDSGQLTMEEFARQFLDQMLDVYIAYYGENYVNTGTAPDDISGLNTENYDFLEMAEILNNSIENAVETISEKEETGGDFRSSQTGYSFSDIRREFTVLDDVEVSNVFAYILENKITKDPGLLLDKYENRINEYEMSNENSEEQVEYINEIIDEYVSMMRESGNTDITYEYILNEVYDNFYTDSENVVQQIDQTVEYDDLLQSYISERSEYENALEDIVYCQYIIDLYSGKLDGTEEVVSDDVDAELQEAEKEASEIVERKGSGDATEDLFDTRNETQTVQSDPEVQVSSAEMQSTTQEMIDNLFAEVDRLYGILEIVNSEFNEYAGAKNIKMLTSIAMQPGINLLIFTVLIVIIFGLIGCIGAIIIGRLQDIFEYYIYVDRKFDIPNRAACDRKIAQYSKSLLKDDFVCISIHLDDIKEKNHRFGRESTDNMMHEFFVILDNVFSQEQNVFWCLNGIGQVLVFGEDMSYNRAYVYMMQLQKEVAEFNKVSDNKIEYTVGVAEAKRNNEYHIKGLVVEALKNAWKESDNEKNDTENADNQKQTEQTSKNEHDKQPGLELDAESFSQESPNRERDQLEKTLEELREILRKGL